MHVLVVGATGAVGRQLVPQLLTAGHLVTGTTRTPAKADSLRAAGAEPVVLDVLDGAAVGELVAKADPEAIIYESTAIPPELNFRKFDQVFGPTNTLRTIGLDNLLAAAAAQGVPRFLAQSYAGWPYARTGGAVKTEADPLDPDPPAAQRHGLAALRHLEDAVTGAGGLALRYGSLYGPGSSEMMVAMLRRRQVPLVGDGAGVWSFLHVTDAAAATVAAIETGAPGVYNIVDDEPATVSEWLPVAAAGAGAKQPLHLPAWLARLAAGEVGVSMMTQIRGCSNAKAKAELGWQPIWPTWREGFRHGLDRAYPADPARPAEGRG
jgi:nucleoside-diphosphate-sugar epimerase